MSYRLNKPEPFANEIKRIVLEQIDQVLPQLQDPGDDRDEVVHDIRKRFKKIRACLRMVRDNINSDVYHRENICYRDVGRLLAPVRDSTVDIETLDHLTGYFSNQLEEGAFDHLREHLVERHAAINKKVLDDEDGLSEVNTTIERARQRVGTLPIEPGGFPIINDGLKRVYQRGYKGYVSAREKPSDENLHEWRKRVKYLWYHMRILNPAWENILDELADELHDLSDYLGDDHDLAIFKKTISKHPDWFQSDRELELLSGMVRQRRNALQESAFPLGEKIFAEKPKDFVKRIRIYWQAWEETTHKLSAQIELSGSSIIHSKSSKASFNGGIKS